MAGISNVVITYRYATYDGIDYCDIIINGTMETGSPGQYAIVRHAITCADEYTMEVYQSDGNETVSFYTRDVINIEGTGADFHPTTGDVTDLYLKYDGAQVGSTHTFTVGDCGEEEDETSYTLAYAAIGMVCVAAAIIAGKELI